MIVDCVKKLKYMLHLHQKINDTTFNLMKARSHNILRKLEKIKGQPKCVAITRVKDLRMEVDTLTRDFILLLHVHRKLCQPSALDSI